MRILMLTDLYPPTIGGVERHVRDLSAELVARGHEVATVTLHQQGLPDFDIDRGVRVYRVRGTAQRARFLFSDPHRPYAPPAPDPGILWALREVITRERPQIVHAHNWMVHSFIPLKPWSHAKLVVTLHDYSLVCPKKTLTTDDGVCVHPTSMGCVRCSVSHYGLLKGLPTTVATRLMGEIERRAVDMFLPVSRAVAIGNGLVSGSYPFRIVPNFVPDDAALPSDEGQERPPGLPECDYVLFVGALGHHKGVDVLVRAYAALADAPPLVLIGTPWPDGPADYPPNVVVLRNVPHSLVMQAWGQCLIGVVPSVCAESCPTVAMEAMAAGRPVIASRVGGLPDLVVDGQTGLLVPPGDVDALRRAIAMLLADKPARDRMGKAGMERAVAFHASRVIPRVEQVYRQIVQSEGECPDGSAIGEEVTETGTRWTSRRGSRIPDPP